MADFMFLAHLTTQHPPLRPAQGCLEAANQDTCFCIASCGASRIRRGALGRAGMRGPQPQESAPLEGRASGQEQLSSQDVRKEPPRQDDDASGTNTSVSQSPRQGPQGGHPLCSGSRPADRAPGAASEAQEGSDAASRRGSWREEEDD